MANIQELLQNESAGTYLQVIAGEKNGSITVENKGAYVAKFSVSYKIGDKSFREESDNFSAGVAKTIMIPADATAVSVLVEEYWFIKCTRTILQENFEGPVTKKYIVTGTTLDPDWHEG